MLTPIEIDHNIIPAVMEMQRNGIRISPDYFHSLTDTFTTEADCINQEISDEYGQPVNVRSGGENGQVSLMLKEIGIYPKKLPVDKKTLAKYQAYPIVRKIQEAKHYMHLVAQFTSKMPKMCDEECRIHTDFLITRTSTWRMASKNPNLQQIPSRGSVGKQVRKGFIPSDGCVFGSIDYSGIEMCCCAHLARDKKMIDAIWNKADLHAMTAQDMFDKDEVSKMERNAGKGTNFKIVYGTTEYGLYDGFILDGLIAEDGSPLYSIDDARSFIDSWRHTWPDSYRYMQALHHSIKMNGYAENIYGFRRPMPAVYSHDQKLIDKSMREGGNMPVQSLAAAIIKIAMPQVLEECKRWEASGIHCKLLLQIHDELLFEWDEYWWQVIAASLREIMENAVELLVPTRCDIEVSEHPHSWGNMKEIEL